MQGSIIQSLLLASSHHFNSSFTLIYQDECFFAAASIVGHALEDAYYMHDEMMREACLRGTASYSFFRASDRSIELSLSPPLVRYTEALNRCGCKLPQRELSYLLG